MARFVIVLSAVSLLATSSAQAAEFCSGAALGMESGKIPDSDISASSSYARSVGPEHARVRVEKGGGAWCPRPAIQHNVREWLEIALPGHVPHLVTASETQGRFGNGQGQEFAEAFIIEYWRHQLGRWVTYKNAHSHQILRGNSNPWLAAVQQLDHPLVAERIRFLPYSHHPRTTCMRVEIYGCPWTGGLIGYGAPRNRNGDQHVDWAENLDDISYDGTTEVPPGHQVMGLGQLTDGVTNDNRTSPNGTFFGSSWVGWMNNGSAATSAGRVELLFAFHSAREFTGLTLHLARPARSVNAPHTPGSFIDELKSCQVNFALEKDNYIGKSVRYAGQPSPDRATFYNVTVDLKRRVGRYLQVQLEFTGQWLLMSEITFQSQLPDGNATDSSDYSTDDADDESDADLLGGSVNPSQQEGPEIPIVDDEGVPAEDEDESFHGISTVAQDERTAYMVVGGVLSIVFLLIGACLIVYAKRRRSRNGKQVAVMLPGGTVGSSGLMLNKLPVTIAPASTSTMIGHDSNQKRTTLLSLKQLGKAGQHSPLMAPSARDGFYGPVPSGNGHAESDSDTSSFYHEPYQQQQQQQQQQHQPVIKYHQRSFQRGYSSATSADPEYGCLIQKEPLVLTPKGLRANGLYHKSAPNTLSSNNNSQPPIMPLPRPPLSAVKQSLLLSDGPQSTTSFTMAPSENYYATTDLIHADRSVLKPLFEENSAMSDDTSSTSSTADNRTTLTSKSLLSFFTAPPPPPPQPAQSMPPFPSHVSSYVIPAASPIDGDLCPPDLSRHQIALLEKLGEGSFGSLHLAEVDCFPSQNSATNPSDFHANSRKLVLLRLIRSNSINNHQEWVRDVRRLSVLRDPSIAKVVAMATNFGPAPASVSGDDHHQPTMGLMTEYLEGGPLPLYLRQYRFGATDNFDPGVKTISLGGMLHMASQIASGMKYLESLGFVHRDVSARNCLVGKGFTIKISDVAVYRSLFTRDYYYIEGRGSLPVRWMAPESLLWDEWSCASDVYSFGITLWELTGLCQQRPWQSMGEPQLLASVIQRYQQAGSSSSSSSSPETSLNSSTASGAALLLLPPETLPRPAHCPVELYRLMSQCWQQEPNNRPTFHEIHAFLQRNSKHPSTSM